MITFPLCVAAWLLTWNFITYIAIFLMLCVATARREIISGQDGVVATDDGTCSRIGRDVLREGGNAIDASVAASFCLGVVSPASSGIGGGGFMLLRLANGTTRAFNMRETAPILASQVRTKIPTKE